MANPLYDAIRRKKFLVGGAIGAALSAVGMIASLSYSGETESSEYLSNLNENYGRISELRRELNPEPRLNTPSNGRVRSEIDSLYSVIDREEGEYKSARFKENTAKIAGGLFALLHAASLITMVEGDSRAKRRRERKLERKLGKR